MFKELNPDEKGLVVDNCLVGRGVLPSTGFACNKRQSHVPYKTAACDGDKSMRQNKYDDQTFFKKYSQMSRSVEGLNGAGEWHELKKLLPDFAGKRVLDLGCGYGWHCIYAFRQGACKVLGIDISEKMLEVAREKTDAASIQYMRMPIEDADFKEDSFDIVLSSLAIHYIEDFDGLCAKVYRWLGRRGEFVFSAEHPVFTAAGPQRWVDDGKGNHIHWPVDRYFTEGKRDAEFLGEKVIKYHRTLTSYVNGMMKAGFTISGLVEPQPPADMLSSVPGMEDELRRPMMLIMSAKKDEN